MVTKMYNIPVKPRRQALWTCCKRHAIYFERWANKENPLSIHFFRSTVFSWYLPQRLALRRKSKRYAFRRPKMARSYQMV